MGKVCQRFLSALVLLTPAVTERLPKNKRGRLSVIATWQVVGAEQVRRSRLPRSGTASETQARGLATDSLRSASAAAFAVATTAAMIVAIEKRMLVS